MAAAAYALRCELRHRLRSLLGLVGTVAVGICLFGTDSLEAAEAVVGVPELEAADPVALYALAVAVLLASRPGRRAASLRPAQNLRAE